MLCLLIFIIFVGILGFVSFLSFYTGDTTALLYEQDYLGNRCGVGTKAGQPKAFYPRIPQDLIEQQEVVQSGDMMNLRLYALCVDECPSTEYGVGSPVPIVDYGFDTMSAGEAAALGSRAEWLSATPTVDILNRCIPRSSSTQDETSMCAFPNCTSAQATFGPAIACAGANSGFMTSDWLMDTTQKEELCKVRARKTTTMTYELATNSEASRAMLSQIASLVGGLSEVMQSIAASWQYILIGGVAAPVFLAYTYMLLLFLFAKVIIYSLLLLLIVSLGVSTFVMFMKSGISFGGTSGQDLMNQAASAANVSVPSFASSALSAVSADSQWLYSIGFVVLAIITAITIVTVLLSRKKIAICAAIITEATTVFSCAKGSMPMLMFFPTLSTLLQCVVCAWFVGVMVLIQTQKPEALETVLAGLSNSSMAQYVQSGGEGVGVDPIGSMRAIITNSWYPTAVSALVLFGFFVLVQFVQGVAWCSMSGAVYYWYFFRNASGDQAKEKTRIPITKSFGRTIFYHTGSIAFAAFVIAICDMLRAVATYIEKQMGPASNTLVKLAFKVLQCCLYCLKKTVKFVSYYGLVVVAAESLPFCLSCSRTFIFFLQNPGQVAIQATVIWLLRLIALFSMPLVCGVGFYYLLEGYVLTPQENAMYPTAIITILAMTMTVSCMTVFECTITTVFVCCFKDKAQYDSKYMSARLAKAFGIDTAAKKKVEEEKAEKLVAA